MAAGMIHLLHSSHQDVQLKQSVTDSHHVVHKSSHNGSCREAPGASREAFNGSYAFTSLRLKSPSGRRRTVGISIKRCRNKKKIKLTLEVRRRTRRRRSHLKGRAEKSLFFRTVDDQEAFWSRRSVDEFAAPPPLSHIWSLHWAAPPFKQCLLLSAHPRLTDTHHLSSSLMNYHPCIWSCT